MSSRAVRRMAASVNVATGAYGVSFGALAVVAGLDLWQTMTLSLLMFSGGSQFAFLGALTGGGLAAGAAAWLVGLRRPWSGCWGSRGEGGQESTNWQVAWL